MTTQANPLAEVVTDLRTGRRDPTEYAASCLDRLDAVDGDVRAFLPEADRPARVRRAAAAREEEHPDGERPPLFGVPVGIKDIFHVDGFDTRAGSDLPPEALAGPQADAVTALLDAGAVVLGKTVTTEFAYFEPGPTRNPHDLDHTPGGSSSGSAAAVAAGATPLALGTQTIGSVVRPASFCGVVGVKPSYDRIPFGGILQLSESADHVGYFTQDLAGARVAAGVLYEEWEGDASVGSGDGPDASGDDAAGGNAADRPVVGVPHDAYLSQAEDRALARFERRLDDLRGAGYEVRETDALADIEDVNARHREMVAAEAALAHTERYAEYGDRYGRGSVDLIETGRDTAVGRLTDARNGRLALRESLAATMDEAGVDVWAAPAAPGPAPEGIDGTGDPVMNLPWTHAGLPTVALPAGEIDDLPMGLQFVSRFGTDERLLAWCDDLWAAVDGT